MSGQVIGGSPWMRSALRNADADELTRVQEAIPTGAHIALICGGRPRPLGAVLIYGINDQRERVEPQFHSVEAACWAVLRKAEAA